MKKIEVIVKDKNTLVLQEKGEKGDYIDLTSLSSIDFTLIEELINEGRDKVYEKKLEEANKNIKDQFDVQLNHQKTEHENILKIELANIEKQKDQEISKLKGEIDKLNANSKLILENEQIKIKNEYESKINELNNKIDSLNSTTETKLKEKELELTKSFNVERQNFNETISEKEKIENQKDQEINKLKSDIESINKNLSLTIENENNKLKNEYEAKINELNNKIQALEKDAEIKLKNQELELKNKFDIEKQDFNKKIAEKTELYEEATKKYNDLFHQKSVVNVKQTGENLESWCDNEMKSYMQNGFLNCTWKKDNEVVKLEDESKGSKADYIFKVYADDKHEDDTLLTSVCLDMKDENPSSTNKKKNSDYYKDLDKNRIKKNCKYALLVSNLETDKPNDLPIFKVNEYPDMYVCRPAYLTTFLNMIVSLTNKFKDLLLQDIKEREELKSQEDFMKQFDALKKTYLDDPLERLEKNIEELSKQNENIIKASQKIDETISKIRKSYLDEINNKLSRFEISITKEYRKLN